MPYFLWAWFIFITIKKPINKDRYLSDVTKNWGYFGIGYLPHKNRFIGLKINNNNQSKYSGFTV